MGKVSSEREQAAFRWRYDDDGEASATWVDAVNTNITVNVDSDVYLRLRVLLRENNGVATNLQPYLSRATNGGSYLNYAVSTPANAPPFNSTYLTDNASTTQQIGSGTFVSTNGGVIEDGVGNTSVSIGGTEFEAEFTIQLVASELTSGDYLDFRVQHQVSNLDLYSQVPRVTVTKTVAELTSTPGAGTLSVGGQQQAFVIGPTDEYLTVLFDSDFTTFDTTWSLSGAASIIEAISAADGAVVLEDEGWSYFEITLGASDLPKSSLDELRTVFRAQYGLGTDLLEVYLQHAGSVLATQMISAGSFDSITGTWTNVVLTWDMASLDAADDIAWHELRIGTFAPSSGTALKIDQMYQEINWSNQGGGTGLTAAPGVGALSLTGQEHAHDLEITLKALPEQGSLVLSGQEHIARGSIDLTLSPEQGSIALNGNAPRIEFELRTLPDAGLLSALGYAPVALPTIERATLPDTGALTLTGNEALAAGGTEAVLLPETGVLALTGSETTAYWSIEFTVSPDGGITAFTGYAATLVVPGLFEIAYPQAGTLAINGEEATTDADLDLALQPQTGSVSISGESHTSRAEIIRTLTPDAAAVTAGGYAPVLDRLTALFPRSGSITAAGLLVSYARQIPVLPGVGALSMSGAAPTLELIHPWVLVDNDNAFEWSATVANSATWVTADTGLSASWSAVSTASNEWTLTSVSTQNWTLTDEP